MELKTNRVTDTTLEVEMTGRELRDAILAAVSPETMNQVPGKVSDVRVTIELCGDAEPTDLHAATVRFSWREYGGAS